VVVSWQQAEAGGSARQALMLIDVKDGSRRVLLDDPTYEYGSPVFSPDASRIAFTRERRSTPDHPIDVHLCVLPVDGGEPEDVAPDWDRWPASAPVWTTDGRALLVTADDQGRSPIWRIDLETRTPARLTGDDAAYTDLQLSRDGSALYALRSSIGVPPTPVRLDPAALDQQPVRLPSPVADPELPGLVTEVHTEAEDGTPVRAWLVLPAGASAEQPAPLLLWVHGGPLGSWNSWSWRWNPWLAAAQGYAVLLPDPALSTGYGLAAIQRSWGRWGAESYTDTMAITDAAVARDDIDADRTAAMGGSYGGYLVNWIAGHTDRFRGIVSHAGLWALDQFGPTTDAAFYWRREMTAEMEAQYSPHLFVDQIRTPMLVIHGDRDYRVPVGEALRLWAELSERGSSPDGVLPHRFLLFPDENHWILKPQNAKLWYATIFAFLAHTVRNEPWQVPDLLR
jgi:dipeptidyl aminopeptidase/acylaminoacyl peptidase